MMELNEIAVEQVGPSRSADMLQRLGLFGLIPVALAAGAVLGLSSAGFDYWWLAWCAIAPLFILLIRCRNSVEAILTGFSFGLGYHLLALSWYLGLLPLRWAGINDWLAVQMVGLSWLAQSAHEALLIALFAWLVYCLPLRVGYLAYFRRPYFPYLLSLPIIWVFMTWRIGASQLFGGVPIDQIAYSQSHNTAFIQIAKLGGAGLVEFLIVMVNAAIAFSFIELSKIGPQIVERVDMLSPRVGAVVDLAISLLVVLLTVAWGRGQIVQNITKQSEMANSSCLVMPVAVVQSNIGVEQERLKLTSMPNVARQEQELIKNLGVAMLVLPEASLDASKESALFTSLKDISNTENKEIICGSIERSQGSMVNAVRFIFPGEINPERNAKGIYTKRHLVPFLDVFPWSALHIDSSSLVPASADKLPAIGEQFATNPSEQLLKSRWGKIGASISFEILFPELIAQQVRKGASLIINLANLSWCRSVVLNKQLLAATVFRSVENQRAAIISSNTGISAVIDSNGIVTSKSGFASRGTLIDTVQFLWEKTMFTKMWWL